MVCLPVYAYARITYLCMQLLSRIAGAASAEELRKVQAEIEAALGFNPHATLDETHVTPDETGQDNMQHRTRHMQDRTRPDETSACSGLTPNVVEIKVVEGGKHL